MGVTSAPPRTLTMEEYRRDWQPYGWELITIGPTATWRSEWGEWEAIRDIVQNALDETDAYQYGSDREGLWISDKGKGVAVADFLLGPAKLKPDYARGKFGEGMKIAALALVRMGYGVHIETVGRELWITFLEQKVNGKVETLAALWRKDGIKTGTMFHIIGYHGDAFDQNFTVNLPKAAILAEGPSPLAEPVVRFNQLLDPAFTGGSRIYARDIYMKDIGSPYSYNLWGFNMSPDRHGPRSDTDMYADMGRLWCCVTNLVHMRVFLKMVHVPSEVESEEGFYIDMSRWAMGTDGVTGKYYTDYIQEAAQAWEKAWTQNFGADAVIRTSDRWDNMVKHLGYTSHSISMSVRDTLSLAITTDKNIIDVSIERLRDAETIPDDKLSPQQLAHLMLARAIASMAHRGPKVRGTYASLIPAASDRVRTAGMYGTNTQEIFIDLSQLDSGHKTVDTVIHELAHHTSGAEDLTEQHSTHMSRLASYVVDLTHAGEFDALMENVVW